MEKVMMNLYERTGSSYVKLWHGAYRGDWDRG